MESGGRAESSDSRAARRVRREERQACERGVESDWGRELRRRVSG